jgi:hypothetical protein
MGSDISLDALVLDASPLEELCSGLTFQWLFNRRAFALCAEHSSHKLVDVWAEKIIEITKTWPKDRTLFILNDFSGKNCAMTTYNQQKNRELFRMFPGYKTVNALVVRQNLTMQLIKLFIRAVPSDRPINMYFTREEATSWLMKQVDMEYGAQSVKS